MTPTRLRDEALMMLGGKGSILDVARRVSRILDSTQIPGAVIGGVAVVLHGHVRTTVDVDVYIPNEEHTFADALRADGFTFDAAGREFERDGVPVHLVTPEQATIEPRQRVKIDDVQTISLADLINLKLASGTGNVLRAQDIADVIGLIRANHLTGAFTRKIHKPLRNEFRRLQKAIRSESN